MIRKATIKDLDDINKVYEKARKIMVENNNPTQWANNYPYQDVLIDFISRNVLYVIEEKGRIYASFAFIVGVDPTYINIEGKWLNDEEYGVIHALGSDGSHKEIFKTVLEFALSQINNIKIDTHEDNLVMRYLLAKFGFKECGIIYVLRGEPRIAYQLIKS